MANPKFLQGKPIKTRPDRPSDAPLEPPSQGANRALERARSRQNRRLRGPARGPNPQRARMNYEKLCAQRRLVLHENSQVQRLAAFMYETYCWQYGKRVEFGILDNRPSIFCHPGRKDLWWGTAEAVLQRFAKPVRPYPNYGCIQA